MVQVTVERVVLDETTEQAVILLADLSKTTYIPIWIRALEASAIALQMQGIAFPRPLTVDLLVNIIEKLGAEVVMVAITEIKDDVFRASLTVNSEGQVFDIDCRPSDAIAVALRTNAPIYANERVIAEAGVASADSNIQ